MHEEKSNEQQSNDLLESEYKHVPQNDKQQIEQVVRDYESDPAKGLAHGVQKDAIQNAFGARAITDEVKACQKNWRCFFELTSIKGKEALVFWDEGTTGLTGTILSMEEIEKSSEQGLLGKEHANQRLARFLTRFESGGNIGPGSFGRGKLIFHGASNDYSILVDSCRSDDEKYIAFSRKMIGNQLKQIEPRQDEKAKKFIHEATEGALKPLTNHGTRVTILNVKDEIVEAFKKSFGKEAEDGGYSGPFSRMIEETWWEIIEFGAKITLKMKEKVKQVDLTEPLRLILKAKDKEKGFRMYEKKNLSVVVDAAPYRIKHLRFIVAPTPIQEELREIWVQRKRMKVGSISRGISLHHKIQKNFLGYVILEPSLEELFEAKESPTHYAFDMRGRGGGSIGQVRAILRSHVEEFHRQLGLRTQSPEAKAQKDMLDTLKELNEQAAKLGLPTDFSSGPQKKDVDIAIEAFTLPNPSSTRIEVGDKVGPIVYRITNNTSRPQFVRLEVTAEQRNRPDNSLLKKEIDLKGNSNEVAELTFVVEEKDYVNGEGILVRARVAHRNSNEQIHQVSRMLWIGMEPPVKVKEPLTITGYPPLFPRQQSRRVELEESIRNIHFRVSSNSAIPLKVNLDMLVRKSKSPTQDVREIIKLVEQRGAECPALSDRDFAVQEIAISQSNFGGIFQEPPDPRERKCEIFFSIRAAANYPTLNMNIGEHLGSRKAIPFYCGIDPAGMSIFKNCVEAEAPDDGRRSWVEGEEATGYTFVLNIEHASYKLADDLGDEFRKYHIREQMLFQAYIISVEKKIFKGAAEAFEDKFLDDNISPTDATRYLDEIVGIALNQLV